MITVDKLFDKLMIWRVRKIFLTIYNYLYYDREFYVVFLEQNFDDTYLSQANIPNITISFCVSIYFPLTLELPHQSNWLDLQFCLLYFLPQWCNDFRNDN